MVEITLNQNEARVQVYNEIPKHKWVPGKKKKIIKKKVPAASAFLHSGTREASGCDTAHPQPKRMYCLVGKAGRTCGRITLLFVPYRHFGEH